MMLENELKILTDIKLIFADQIVLCTTIIHTF